MQPKRTDILDLGYNGFNGKTEQKVRINQFCFEVSTHLTYVQLKMWLETSRTVILFCSGSWSHRSMTFQSWLMVPYYLLAKIQYIDSEHRLSSCDTPLGSQNTRGLNYSISIRAIVSEIAMFSTMGREWINDGNLSSRKWLNRFAWCWGYSSMDSFV